MNPKNAEELLSQPDVDGGLIGGASMKADSFYTIVETANKLS
jgi:triosephosphate isomerase